MRYLLFVGSAYYATGGMMDFVAKSDEVEDLFYVLRENRKDTIAYHEDPSCAREHFDAEWWHIFDCKKGLVIFKSREEAHGAGNWNVNYDIECQQVKIIADEDLTTIDVY